MDTFVTANAVFSLFSKNYMELKKGLPVRPSEMGVLNILTELPGPHTPALLAELLGVSKPMITAHLSSLSDKGYIIKQPSQEDRRVCYILPTDKAAELTERAKQDMTQQLRHLSSSMGHDRFTELIRLTQEANQILKQKEK